MGSTASAGKMALPEVQKKSQKMLYDANDDHRPIAKDIRVMHAGRNSVG